LGEDYKMISFQQKLIKYARGAKLSYFGNERLSGSLINIVKLPI